ncbi:MAG: DUF4331 family protein [Candidatus Eremiobacteraeota bacterium]|nr:DUF4331 family protein [Candidatus Eremiobacteraeota bacterium]
MKRLAISLFAAAALIAGCGSDDPTFTSYNNFQPNNNTPNTPAVTYRQIEQLARPGINEALLFSNAFLNRYNSVGPQFIATALANPTSQEGVAAGPVFTEATAVLQAIMDVPGVAGLLTTPAQAVTAFLPDVMRVDSTLNIAPAQGAYAFALNTSNSPVAGRKLTDDVIDITYIVLLDATGAVNDHVNYAANANNPATGHQPLITTFPYLAPAN